MNQLDLFEKHNDVYHVDFIFSLMKRIKYYQSISKDIEKIIIIKYIGDLVYSSLLNRDNIDSYNIIISEYSTMEEGDGIYINGNDIYSSGVYYRYLLNEILPKYNMLKDYI